MLSNKSKLHSVSNLILNLILMEFMKKMKTQSKKKRESIIQAARSCFQKEGVDATSMDKISEVAQVSKRTVYNHFESKEALLIHLLSDLWISGMVDVQMTYQADVDLRHQLIELCLVEIKLVTNKEYLNLARVAYAHYMFKPLPDEIQNLVGEETFIHRWVRAALLDGKLKELDVEIATKQLHSLIKGQGHWPQIINITKNLTSQEQFELAKITAEMFLSYYQKLTK